MEHLEAAVEAMEIKLSPVDIEYLEEPYAVHPILDIVNNSKGKRSTIRVQTVNNQRTLSN